VKIVSPTVKTFTFIDKLCAKANPGQFLMLWIPGVDEIPLSIADVEKGDAVSVAVRKVGEATQALHDKKTGATIGVRGPFGNSFTLKGGNVILIGGGTGIAPLKFLTKKLKVRARKLGFVLGAKTRDELLFMNEIRRTFSGRNAKLVVSTEDGSCGITGLCTDPLEALLTKEKIDMIYTCGPEQMIRKVCDLAEKYKIDLEASLERLMRCAIGLCGSCVIGNYRVCRDGPVFSDKQLKRTREELGVSKRDFDGREIPV
jgi:dihydroorotate dehydrogenase electron transfer subunit